MDGELPVDSVEPDGTTEVPKRRKGLLGLLSFMGTALLGVLGVVGIIPAGKGGGGCVYFFWGGGELPGVCIRRWPQKVCSLQALQQPFTDQFTGCSCAQTEVPKRRKG